MWGREGEGEGAPTPAKSCSAGEERLDCVPPPTRVASPEKSSSIAFHLRPEALHRRRTVIQDHTESYIIRISGALAFR